VHDDHVDALRYTYLRPASGVAWVKSLWRHPITKRLLRYTLMAVVLSAANFAYQAFTGRHWDVALERAVFQSAACLLCAFIR